MNRPMYDLSDEDLESMARDRETYAREMRLACLKARAWDESRDRAMRRALEDAATARALIFKRSTSR